MTSVFQKMAPPVPQQPELLDWDMEAANEFRPVSEERPTNIASDVQLGRLHADFNKSDVSLSHDASEDDMDVHNHERQPSIASAAASGFINFLLMFGLCCAYGLIMFDGEANQQFQALGVKMNLCTAAFVGVIVALKSRIPVAIAGPDLNPVVFLGYFVVTISQQISVSLGMSYPGMESTCGERRLRESAPEFARALSSCSSDRPAFCGGQDGNSPAQCSAYAQQLVTTTIFAVFVSSALLAMCFFLVGRFNFARYASFVPTSISEAFLSCVGYKVFLYALQFSNNDPVQFLPAAFLGVLLFFVKARHWGNPAVVIPLMLMVPLGIFHLLVGVGVGFDGLDDARNQRWMFPRMDNVGFYKMWTEGVYDGEELKFQHINFSAWMATFPDLLTMVIVVLLDSMLKVKNTENKMPIVPQADYELQLFGGCNALMAVFGAPVGYMQLKFNVINYGIIGNTKDRRAGVLYACLCAVTFFWTIEPFNFMPRWFLSTLLFFAGAGFVAENLWGSRRYLSHSEWLEILFIVVVFIVTDMLIWAVAAGGFITLLSFLSKYAAVPAIAGPAQSGGEVASYKRHGPLVQLGIRNIADSWFVVVRLKGFVFFGSAKSAISEVTSRLHAERSFAAALARPEGGEAPAVEVVDGEGGPVLLVRDASAPCIAAWNSRHPQAEIMPGDRVEEVNGLTGDAAAMAEEMRTAAALQVRLHRDPLPKHRRLRWVVFDCELLDGMDASACAVFRKLVNDAQSHGVTCLWTKVGETTRASLDYRGILSDRRNVFAELGQAVHHIEQRALKYRAEQLDRWMQVHPGLALCREQTAIADEFDPFRHVFETDAERQGCPWRYCSRMQIQPFQTILWEPDAESTHLYLVHSGAVGLYDQLPAEGAGPQVLPSAVYGHGWFLNREFLLHASTRACAIAVEPGEVVFWTQEQWNKMSRERPLMAAAIVKAAMRQQSYDLQYATGGASPPPGSRTAEQARSYAASGCHSGPAPHLPQELRVPLQRLSTARALEQLGLFEAPAEGEETAPLPELPAVLRDDVAAAFDTFCEQTPEGPRLGPCQVGPALMFAGIFGTVLDHRAARALTEAEFVALAHQALVAPLTASQQRAMTALFQQHDANGSGTLDRGELPQLFESRFAMSHFDEIDSAAREVQSYRPGSSLEGHVDERGFLWIVGRLVRKHEHDHLLLITLRDLSGGEASHEMCHLSLEALKRSSRLQNVSDAQWEEMCWAVGLGAGASGADGVDFHALVAAVTAQQMVLTLLPPFDAQKLRARREKESKTQAWLRNDVEAARKMVVDLRIEPEKRVQPPMLCPVTLLESSSPQAPQESSDEHEEVTLTAVANRFDPAQKRFQGLPQDDLSKREKLLVLLEEPNSCGYAQRLSMVLAALICVSMLATFFETFFQTADMRTSFRSPWVWAELWFTVIFTIELSLRFWAHSKLGASALAKFFLKPSNLLDLLAILPLYSQLVTTVYIGELHLFRIARLVRISRADWVRRLARRFTLVGPVATVLVVIWGIYLKETSGGDKGGSCS